MENVLQEETQATEQAGVKAADAGKKGYVGIHSTGFKDFLLKPELLRAIVDCGFEHPSEGGPTPALFQPLLPMGTTKSSAKATSLAGHF